MAMLGDVLAEARRSSGAFTRWLAAADAGMARRVEAAAAREARGATAYVRGAVAEFGLLASEEDWATLISRLKSAEDPGTACLVRMVEWRLAADGEGPVAAEKQE